MATARRALVSVPALALQRHHRRMAATAAQLPVNHHLTMVFAALPAITGWYPLVYKDEQFANCIIVTAPKELANTVKT